MALSSTLESSATASLKKTSGVAILSALLFLSYSYLFFEDVRGLWFNPLLTTDDSFQQLFPFYSAVSPEIFAKDLIFELMKGYLPPLHWALGYGITTLTGDPIITGQVLMSLQFGLACLFLFLLTRALSNSWVGLLAITWFMHSQPVWQRCTGGLPRGWPLVLVPATLYFMCRLSHWGVHATLLACCLLNPPAFPALALSYGGLLLLLVYRDKRSNLKPLIGLIASTPVYAIILLSLIQRPPEIGPMVKLAQAEAMPEFRAQGGRFPFLPFPPISDELNRTATQVFVSKLVRTPPFLKQNIGVLLLLSSLCLCLLARLRRAHFIPLEVGLYLGSTMIIYLLSRPLAFLLYVPDRHLLVPVGLSLIVIFLVGIWRTFGSTKDNSRPATIAIGVLLLAIYCCSADGLSGVANFNRSRRSTHDFHHWLKLNTPASAVIGCHPDTCDSIPLFAARRAYAFTEAAHPFYPTYYRTIEARLKESFQLHYSRDLDEFFTLARRAGIDYFVFRRADFYPERLASATYYLPLDNLVHQLASAPVESFVYKRYFSPALDSRHPSVVYTDAEVVIVDTTKVQSLP